MSRPLRLVVIGLSMSSSWGNGHATTYRGLLRALSERGHDILFLERDQPWYADHRDLRNPSYCRLALYRSLCELDSYTRDMARADAVIVGSFVPEGVAVGHLVHRHARGVTAFYDIDTPVTLTKLARGDHEYVSPDLIRRYHLYLSFTGGPTLARLEREFGSPAARALFCSVDADSYKPVPSSPSYDLGYLGTYSEDRQPALQRLLIEPARRRPDLRFIVAGAQFPQGIDWPGNVSRVDHVGPADHPAFYGSLRLALNVTRTDMIRAGFSPSVRLFEAGACAAPLVSDSWPGLDRLLTPDREVIVVHDTDDVLAALARPPDAVRRIGLAARRRVLAEHTSRHRAMELEAHLEAAMRGPLRVAAKSGAPLGNEPNATLNVELQS
jgi:spore maturation protein CgeB